MEDRSLAADNSLSIIDTNSSINSSTNNPQLSKNHRYLGTVKRHLNSQDRKRPLILDINPSLVRRLCPGVTLAGAQQVCALAARDCLKLEENDNVESLFSSAADLMNEDLGMVSLGCPLIDHSLRGGLRRGAVTEVCGESSAGKTQFCLQAALQAQLVGVTMGGGAIVTSYGGQEGVAGYGGQQGVASYGGQEGVASYGGQQGVASYGGQEGVASYGGQQGVANYGGQQSVALGGGKVVYICTEDQFPSSRLSQMLAARYGSEQCPRVDNIRDGILIQRPRDIAELETALGPQLEAIFVREEVSLIIVDSIAALFRGEFEGEGLARANAIHRLGMRINSLARERGVAVLVVNQVTDFMDQPQCSFGRRVVAALGMTWANYVHTRLFLTKTRLVVAATRNAQVAGIKAETRLRTMEVDVSPRLPRSKTYFTVEADGLKGVRIT